MALKEEAAVVAPMPGIVVHYEVELGSSVKIGEVVVILESMKIHNRIPSPVNGIVKAINFKPGDAVKKGDVLAVVG